MGIAITVSLVLFAPFNIAHGDDNEDTKPGSAWNRFFAIADTADFSWNSIFNPRSRGKNIYVLAYQKLHREGQNLALQEISKAYGLTTDESQAVLAGTLTPLLIRV